MTNKNEPTYDLDLLNFGLFCVGMLGLWLTTHNWQAMLWAFVASLHIKVKIKNDKN